MASRPEGWRRPSFSVTFRSHFKALSMGFNLSTLLLVAVILVPLIAMPVHCGYRRIEIDHFATLSLGFLFYWVFPIAVGMTGAMRGPILKDWYEMFDEISDQNLATFLVVALGAYCAFLAGTYVGGRVRIRRSGQPREIKFNRSLLKIALTTVSLLVIFLAIALRHKFLGDYAITSFAIDATDLWSAAYQAACSLLVAVLLFDCATRNRVAPSPLLFRGRWPNRFFLIYFAAGLFDLSMGTRLYFVSGILMLCVYRSVFLQPFRPMGLLMVASFGLLLAGSIGVWRMRFHHTSISLGLSIGAESLFTGFSLLSLLSTYRIPLLRFPIELLSNLVALVPTFIWADKWKMFVTLEDLGYVILAPYGALNSFVEFMVNFGAVGTIVVWFGIGVAMMRLKIAARSPLTRVIYTMISGWFALSFFRDPFFISVVKSILEFSILVPLTLAGTLHLLSRNLVFTPTVRTPLPLPE
jgi:hypothetical protein